jgi:uncharacterized membrane-anchored protein
VLSSGEPYALQPDGTLFVLVPERSDDVHPVMPRITRSEMVGILTQLLDQEVCRDFKWVVSEALGSADSRGLAAHDRDVTRAAEWMVAEGAAQCERHGGATTMLWAVPAPVSGGLQPAISAAPVVSAPSAQGEEPWRVRLSGVVSKWRADSR